MNVLITGASGQLGKCLLEEIPSSWSVMPTDREILDITAVNSIDSVFAANEFDLCINCAAYTAVDLAESNRDACFAVNVTGARNIARACSDHNVKLIHLSTDYVYHALEYTPLHEDAQVAPRSVYGKSKLEGERQILERLPSAIIVRTSWLYSEYGRNFFLTMLRLSNQGIQPRVVNDQFGTPTYARDLAAALIVIARKMNEEVSGVYNVSNGGETNWHEFASEIFKLNQSDQIPLPIPTSEYPTAAQRPVYSVMSLTKAKHTFGIEMRNWQEAVKDCFIRVTDMA